MLVALAAALTGLVLSLDELGVLHLATTTKVVAVVLTAVLAAGATAAAAVDQYRSGRAEARREKATFRLRTLSFTIQDLSAIDVRDIGLALYVVRRDWRHPRTSVLARVARDRAAHRAAVSGLVWRPGMGVIGLCVLRGDLVGVDVAAAQAPMAHATPAQWAGADPEVTLGLTYAQFQATRDKYHAVVAAPVVDSGSRSSTVVGCLSVDGPPGSFPQLWADDVQHALIQAADDLADLLA